LSYWPKHFRLFSLKPQSRQSHSTTSLLSFHLCSWRASASSKVINAVYSWILATTPAPTVRPPSRIAKRKPSSIAIGAIRDTCICTLSPGMTISTPSGNSHAPVTSVVRK